MEATQFEPTADAINRKNFVIFGGNWYVEGDELVQSDSNEEFAHLVFGDESWTDYVFNVDLMRTEGRLSASLLVRQATPSFYLFALGHGNHSLAEIHTDQLLDNGQYQWWEVARQPAGLENYRWYSATVSVSGNHMQCWLRDGNEIRQLFDDFDDRLSHGRVGLRTVKSAFRFKNIKVTTPDGAVLWEGLPEL